MKKFKFTINGNQYETEILTIEDNIAEIEINGTLYKVEVDKEIKPVKTPKLVRPVAVPSTDSHPSVAKTSSPSGPKGTGSIKSPLPGVILEVFVREGDEVKMGQKLLLLEAMKMENNIEADKVGKVVSILKNKGDSVMEGDVLIIIGE
ncbi:MAG: acetyl-CoA carboxylase biotin carboxyl carrier protein subunit [Bacteroidetes bacterium GWF2_42_66]|nr:MAG: acetyl-CoA carboxylase biotin carboxyl carrier protein subunit [Bacteroidetes bacterium GWA2_42_15]OFX98763.1 MAG: acetyl-CoA carboxylase biotin carboxyl carrier protein subunit [Bacteroidetes bacterium GWE2_42_39]OFY43040.1 MAG: acetyl-CoA carboxylase biotin carboxyl carrier protein subunit [Bacteroidetes bacterium GWF2_42_66]HAZ02818.1 acetyl-CoA carboxylase biotin carboxyl carrier protein subunit [Marinilabiliales bacterium]HBL77120.1 acetyl-CoA carboxylase biotin carboxyl carrier pr